MKRKKNIKNLFKPNLTKLLATSLIFSQLLTNLAFASTSNSGTQTVYQTFDASTSQAQTQSLVLPNYQNIVNIEVTDGLDNPINDVTYSTKGNNLTLNLDGAAPSSTQSNPTKYSKEVSQEQTQTADEGEIFPYNLDYSDADGYTGKITRNGSSYVKEGKYTPATDRWFEIEKYSNANSFADLIPYNLAGYSGSLEKMGEAKKEKLDEDETKHIKVTSPYYYKGTMNGREVAALGDQGLSNSPEWFIEQLSLTEFGDLIQYSVDGFEGQLELKSGKPTGKIFTAGSQSVIGEGYIESNVRPYSESVSYTEVNDDTGTRCEIRHPHHDGCSCGDPYLRIDYLCWDFVKQTRPEYQYKSTSYTMNNGSVTTRQLGFSEKFNGITTTIPSGSESRGKVTKEVDKGVTFGFFGNGNFNTGGHKYSGQNHTHEIIRNTNASDSRAYVDHYRRGASSVSTNQQAIPSTYSQLNNLIATSSKSDYKNSYGNIGYVRFVSNGELMIKFDTPVTYEGNVIKKAGTQYVQKYAGLLEKPAIDTRTWGQLYSGTAYKNGLDDLYQYKVEVTYATNSLPDLQDLDIAKIGDILQISGVISHKTFGSQVKAYFRISPKGSPGTPYVGVEMADKTVYLQQDFSYEFDLTKLAKGQYDLYIWAVDSNSQKSPEYKLSFDLFDTVSLTPLSNFVIGNDLVFKHDGGLNFANAITEVNFNGEVLSKDSGDWQIDESTLTIGNVKNNAVGTFSLSVKATNYYEITKEIEITDQSTNPPTPPIKPDDQEKPKPEEKPEGGGGSSGGGSYGGSSEADKPKPEDENIPKPDPGQEGGSNEGGQLEIKADEAYISGYTENGQKLFKPEAIVSRAEMAAILDRVIIFKKVLGKENMATDINGHWAESEIVSNLNNGVMKGYPDHTFKPDSGITRAEFATVLANIVRPTPTDQQAFNDVAGGHWAEKEINALAAAGVLNGYEDKFKPNQPITRAEAVTLINRVSKLDTSNIEQLLNEYAQNPFADVSPTHWAYRDIIAASYFKN